MRVLKHHLNTNKALYYMVGVDITWTTIKNMGVCLPSEDLLLNRIDLGVFTNGVKRAIQDIAARPRPILKMSSAMHSFVSSLAHPPVATRILRL